MPHPLLFVTRHLRRAKLVGQLVDLSREAERQLVAIVHRGAGITADVKGLVDRHQEGNRMRHRLFGDLLAINREHTGGGCKRSCLVRFRRENGAGRDRLRVGNDVHAATLRGGAGRFNRATGV